MPKLALSARVLMLLAAPMPAAASVLGPHAGECDGHRPAMLVKVIGLKQRAGTIRVQSYGGDPATFLDKGTYLERVDLPIPREGAVEVCMAVPRAGTYAVSVRHKTPGDSSMDDGGGTSGNPRMSLFDLMFKRKPDPAQISVHVAGLVTVPVVMNYVQGGSFRPVNVTER